MVQAYSVFPNQGVRVEPFGILTVKDSSGHVLENNSPVGQQVLDPKVAYIMAHTMKDVIDQGTGRIIRRLGFTYPAAGKTGTTNDNVDAWFIGYTPDLTCGVWLGYDNRISLGKKQTGGEVAAPVWAEFMKTAMEGKPKKDFEPPKGSESEFVTKKICLDSGLLATTHCPKTRDEIFRKESAPTKYCSLHGGAGGGTPGSDDAGGSAAAGGGDILEMDAQPVAQAAPTPSSTVEASEETGTEEQDKKAASDKESYPDEGF
jgi:penicillin-binding protein 1A